MNQKILLELRNLGLSEKEAKVYVAALQIGSASMQKIAKVAGVNRATTYVLVEALMIKGLMSSITKGKKRLFTAEDPSKLLNIIQKQRLELDSKEKAVKTVMEDLKEVFDTTSENGNKPRVKFYEGKEGLNAVRSELLKSKSKKTLGLFNLESLEHVFSYEETKQFSEKRVDKKIFVEAIYSSEKVAILPLEDKKNLTVRTFIDKSLYTAPIDITVYDDVVAISSFEGAIMSVLIENKNIALAISQVLEIVRAYAQEIEKKK